MQRLLCSGVITSAMSGQINPTKSNRCGNSIVLDCLDERHVILLETAEGKFYDRKMVIHSISELDFPITFKNM